MLRNTRRTGGDLRGVSGISDRVSTQTTRRASTKSTRVSSVAGRAAAMLRQCQRTTPGKAARQPQALRGVIRQGLARSRINSRLD